MSRGSVSRFYTERIANSLGITGWVSNLANGKVKIIGVGSESDIMEFLSAIQRGPSSASVENVDYDIENVDKNEYGSFEIEDY